MGFAAAAPGKDLSPRKERLKRLAKAIPDQATLDRVLAGLQEPLRPSDVFAALRPHLPFEAVYNASEVEVE